jgi:hypothetical protein
VLDWVVEPDVELELLPGGGGGPWVWLVLCVVEADWLVDWPDERVCVRLSAEPEPVPVNVPLHSALKGSPFVEATDSWPWQPASATAVRSSAGRTSPGCRWRICSQCQRRDP